MNQPREATMKVKKKTNKQIFSTPIHSHIRWCADLCALCMRVLSATLLLHFQFSFSFFAGNYACSRVQYALSDFVNVLLLLDIQHFFFIPICLFACLMQTHTHIAPDTSTFPMRFLVRYWCRLVCTLHTHTVFLLPRKPLSNFNFIWRK